MNEAIVSLITAYAKQNKQSKAKLVSLVEECFKHVEKPVKASSSDGKRGRQASESIVELRNKIREMKPQLAQSAFTIAQIASMLKAQHVEVGNTINYLAKNEGLFVKTGYEKVGGGKGRPSAKWEVV